MQIKDLKPSDIIQAMVDGLKEIPEEGVFKVAMYTYGDYRYTNNPKKNICIGCAATCAIQKLYNVRFDISSIQFSSTRAEQIKQSESFLGHLESAVNVLRSGNVESFLFSLNEKEFNKMRKSVDYSSLILVSLNSDTYLENLQPYEKLAELFREIGY